MYSPLDAMSAILAVSRPIILTKRLCRMSLFALQMKRSFITPLEYMIIRFNIQSKKPAERSLSNSIMLMYWRRDGSQWFADFRRHRCFVARLGTPQKSGCHWRVAGFLEVKLPLKVHCFFISMVNTPSEGGLPDDFRRGNWRYAALLVGLYKKNPRHKTNDIRMFLKIDIAFRAILV